MCAASATLYWPWILALVFAAFAVRSTAHAVVQRAKFASERMPSFGRSVRQRVWLPGPNEAMLALANHGPVVGDMWIDPAFVSLPAGKVYRFQDTSAKLLHSVCVIGFERSQGYWIVSNSFGQKWGDGGFAKIAFGSGGLLDQRGGWQIVI